MDRQGVTHKVTLYQCAEAHGTGQALGEHPETPTDFYITLNRYPDGRPCEVFAKATNGYQGWCDAVCRLVSLLLQHGVVPAAICRQLAFAHFAPCGRVPHFGFARSFVDYLARWMEGQTTDRRPQTEDFGVEVIEPRVSPSTGLRAGE